MIRSLILCLIFFFGDYNCSPLGTSIPGPDPYGGETISPSIDFSAYPTSGPAPLAVQFYNKSNVEGTIWSFGDGHSSSEESPVHVYEKPGTYAVSLKKGSLITGRGGYIRVSEPAGIGVPVEQ